MKYARYNESPVARARESAYDGWREQIAKTIAKVERQVPAGRRILPALAA